MFKCDADFTFAIRTAMKKNPFLFNFLALTSSILAFSHAVRVCESPLSRITDTMDYHYIGNSLWAVVLTMTTGKPSNLP